MLPRHIISIQLVIYLVLPEIYNNKNARHSSLKLDYNNGVGIHLVVCPLLQLQEDK